MGNLGERVRQVRESEGLTQDQLAKKVRDLGYKKMSQQGIGTIETRGDVRPQCLWELARALNKNEQWLIYGTGPEDRLDEQQRFNEALMHEVVTGVEAALLKQGLANRTTPQARADLSIKMYKYFTDVGSEKDKQARAELIELQTQIDRV